MGFSSCTSPCNGCALNWKSSSLLEPLGFRFSCSSPNGVLALPNRQIKRGRITLASLSTSEPLLVKTAMGNPVGRPPAWMMLQAGRYLAVYRKLAEKYLSFRERSGTTDLVVEASLQPRESFHPVEVTISSEILTPVPAFGVLFNVGGARDPGIQSLSPNSAPLSSPQNVSFRRDVRAFAGRSKKKPGGPSPGRIEGNADLRRELKRNARRKSKKLAESLFYRLKNPHGNHADKFSEDELQMIGLGYDRMVRFMEKDDPNLKHPYDWYRYGEFGPYSWRGVVLGEPVRGRLSDENVTLIGEVRDHGEWEKIEQFEMAQDFGQRLESMDKNVGFKYFWVFVRHPKWRISESPWEQWSLVSEVVLEAGNQRLDKWNLMGRLGNKTRALITKCAAWMRPDIIYVKRPVYQCRFEPQDEFFKAVTPLLDPETENNFMCELENDDGSVELCTYFGGLCKIVRVNPKAFVDDVVNAYEKLSDQKKSKCLMFLLGNHPVELLHPYTKEWKAKLEEMELGCDAPDEDDDCGGETVNKTEFVDWIEDDKEGDGDGERDDLILEMEGNEEEEDDNDEERGGEEDDDSDSSPQEEEKHWEEEFRKAMSSNEAMESLVRKSIETSNSLYEKQSREAKGKIGYGELEMRGRRAKVGQEEWKRLGFGPRMRKVKKSRIPPGLFLKAAVRPFTYRNLVKEIVLTRHAILEREIGSKK